MHNRNIVEPVGRLVDAARAGGDLVVWVLHSEPGSGGSFDPELGEVRLMRELDRRPEEPLVVKTSVNAFTSTNLQQQLTQQGIHELVICGIRTEQCCETTTRHASDLGWQVDYVTEATLTFDMVQPDGRPLPAADIMARTATVLQDRFATVCSVEQALAHAAG